MPEVRFSIIVRCTRGMRHLSRLLRALDDQDYPADRFEVIVADSSVHRTDSAPSKEPPQTSFGLRRLLLPKASRAAALNISARESRGEFLAFLDEDCIPAPDWLNSYDKAFDAWLAGVVGGSFQPPKDGDAYQKCVGLVHSSLARSLGLMTGQQLVGRYFPRSGNMAARKESILLAGGFDEDAAECPEIRMVSRMQHIGYRTFYCPDAAVSCYQDPGLFGFVGEDFRIAAERARFCRRTSINFFFIGVAMLVLLMLGLAYDTHVLAGQAVRLTAGGYVLALAVSSVHAAVSVGSIAVAVFLPMFLVIHHAVYVLGSAYGRFTRVL